VCRWARIGCVAAFAAPGRRRHGRRLSAPGHQWSVASDGSSFSANLNARTRCRAGESIRTSPPKAHDVPIRSSRFTGMAVLPVLALASASGCMVVPRTVSTYNADCQVVEKHMTLETQQVGAVTGCHNNAECVSLLAVYGLVAATSAVVSGSVAVVGNVVYWVERRGQCSRQDPERSLPEPTSPASQGLRAVTPASSA
jgi:hypothetical protein